MREHSFHSGSLHGSAAGGRPGYRKRLVRAAAGARSGVANQMERSHRGAAGLVNRRRENDAGQYAAPQLSYTRLCSLLTRRDQWPRMVPFNNSGCFFNIPARARVGPRCSIDALVSFNRSRTARRGAERTKHGQQHIATFD